MSSFNEALTAARQLTDDGTFIRYWVERKHGSTAGPRVIFVRSDQGDSVLFDESEEPPEPTYI